MLRLAVRLALFDEEQAAGMLTWPHSGFHLHTAVWVPEDDRAFATRLARYCARYPVALERLTYDRAAKEVTYRSDQSDGPTAGTETGDPLEFLARVQVHIPDTGHVTTRDYGWYANRPRGMREKVAPEASRRWAYALRQPCSSRFSRSTRSRVPPATGPIRVVAFITRTSVIDQILTHLPARAAYAGARSPPSTRGPSESDVTRRRAAPHRAR